MSDDLIKRSNIIKAYVEPKQGEWVCELINPLNAILRCSVCGYATGTKYKYCPNCGSRMKGADDETN